MKKGGAPVPTSSALLSTKGGVSKFNPKLYERPGLSEDEVTEIKEAFDLFDPESNGSVAPKGLIISYCRS